MISLALFELKFRQKLLVVTNFGAFWKDQNLKSKPGRYYCVLKLFPSE